MTQVLVRISRHFDVAVEAEFGDTTESLLAKAVVADGAEPTEEVRVFCGTKDELAGIKKWLDAVAASDAKKDPAHARTGVWDVSEMDDASYRAAKVAAANGHESAASDVAAYEDANRGGRGKRGGN